VRKDRVILVVATVYLAVILFGHLPDHLILFPTKAPIDAGGAVRKTVPFQNGELELWTAESHRAKQNGRADIYILRFYGNADRVALQIPRDLDSISNAKAIHAPAIFLLADRDEVVAPRFHRLVVDAYAGEKHVISLPGAYHNDPIEGVALADLNRALDWLLLKKDN